MKADELLDLTNDPLLAYLLILSGYVSDRWQEAAENRNRIYRAIFDQIWIRERNKPTRLYLNDLGREGFEFLLQSLGLAAWRGGGRTGDALTFVSVRDTFMRRDLLEKAKSCGAAELGNVALLFYTRKDEEGGQGYEFLHKSFGEYLTARGLFSAYLRWGQQVRDPASDFDAVDFLQRWLKLSGPAPITREILSFLRNEIRLFGSDADVDRPWQAARDLVETAEKLIDMVIRDGIPPPEGKYQWRAAEIQQRNAEETLMALLDALARTAYPRHLLHSKLQEGSWEPGPIVVSELGKGDQFVRFLSRLTQPANGWQIGPGYSGPINSSIIFSMLSRISIKQDITIIGFLFSRTDLFGANLTGVNFVGCAFVESNLSHAKFNPRCFELSLLANTDLTGVDLRSFELFSTYLDAGTAKSTKLTKKQKQSVTRKRGDRFGPYYALFIRGDSNSK